MGRQIEAAAAGEIPLDSLKRVTVGEREICIAHTATDEWFAIDDVCSHEWSSLSDGLLRGDTVECPQHSSRFSLRTGEPALPPAEEPVATFPVTVENGVVYVTIDEP